MRCYVKYRHWFFPMDKPSVFISHSFSDESWVRQFANSLQERGLKVWFDAHEVPWGQSLTEAVEKGLRESSVIVCLITPDSLRRPNLFFELGAAIGMGKALIPVLSKDLDPMLLPDSLRERRYLLKNSPEATAQELVSEAMTAQ
jgi:predicted nucleotide-binding protein